MLPIHLNKIVPHSSVGGIKTDCFMADTCTADEIMTSLRPLLSKAPGVTVNYRTTFGNCIDAAETIAHCSRYQKRIVDDIITMTKLDSDLFTITPVVIQPATILKQLLKMFEGELRAANIKQQFLIEESLTALAVEWVLLDSSRVLQILTNLVTNAIRFTQPEARREIQVSIGGSLEQPTDSIPGFQYLSPRKTREDLTSRLGWDNGDSLFLHFKVRDTGHGLTEEGKEQLFAKVSRPPRSHATYGGSGVGLFISKELAEMHGGRIGVASQAGEGSMFGFYIKARRAPTPVAELSPYQPQLQLRHLPNKEAVNEEQPGQSTSYTATMRSVEEAAKVYALIVEDNLVNQRVLSKQLLRIGYEVSIANHGGEALEFLRTTRFWDGTETNGKELSVVLMDIEMPVMDGITCAQEIRGLEKAGSIRRHVPIIAVTANARTEQIRMALEAGMVRQTLSSTNIEQFRSSVPHRLISSLLSPVLFSANL